MAVATDQAELRRGAQGHDDGGQQSLRPGVRRRWASGSRAIGGRDGVLGAVRTAVTGPDVRPRRPPAHAPKYGTTIDHYAEVTINARLMAPTIPRRGSASRSRSRITTRAAMIADPLRLVRLLHGDRLRLRGDRHHRRAGRRPAPDARVHPRRGRWARRAGSAPRSMGSYNMPDDDFASSGQRSVAEELYRVSGRRAGRPRRGDGLRPLHRRWC